MIDLYSSHVRKSTLFLMTHGKASWRTHLSHLRKYVLNDIETTLVVNKSKGWHAAHVLWAASQSIMDLYASSLLFQLKCSLHISQRLHCCFLNVLTLRLSPPRSSRVPRNMPIAYVPMRRSVRNVLEFNGTWCTLNEIRITPSKKLRAVVSRVSRVGSSFIDTFG